MFIFKICRFDSPVSVQNLLFYQGRSDDVIGHNSSISVTASLGKEEKKLVQGEMNRVLVKYRLVSDTEDIVIPFHTELYIAEKDNCC